MSFYSELNQVYRDLDNVTDDISVGYIVVTITQMLLKLDEHIFDEQLSKVSLDQDGLEIRMYSKENRHIPIFISVFKDKVVDIQVDSGGEYLYLQSIREQAGLYKLRATINDLLKSEFCAQYFMQNGAVRKVIYTMPYLDNDETKIYTFGYAKGSLWFWNKTETKDIIFEPWIK